MENSTDFDMESIYFDDDVLFYETVMEIITWEKEKNLCSRESRLDLPDVMTEDGFRFLKELAGAE